MLRGVQLTAIVPSALARAWQRRRRSPVWQGVYRSFDEVPASGPGFSGAEWLRQSRAALAAVLTDDAEPPVPSHHLLLLGVAAICAQASGKVRILDFGGGPGTAYALLKRGLPPGASVEYHIVEGAGVCDLGRAAFADDPSISFHTEIPPSLGPFDLVYVNSAIQYVPDYRELLRALAGRGAQHLLLSRLSSGPIRTYATAQTNVPGSIIPYWFLSSTEVLDLLSGLGYVRTLQVRDEYPVAQHDFSPELRIQNTRTFLLTKART